MTLQAKLTLDRAFLYAISDPTTVIACGTSGQAGGGGYRTDVFTQDGAFRSYANGVTRLITGNSNSRVQNVTLRALLPAQLDALGGMIGQTCLFRDTYGRRFYGSFLVTTTTDIPLSGVANDTLLTDVVIAFTAITYDESV